MKKRQNTAKTTNYTLRERFDYWFDNRMAKGSLSFIRILAVASVLLAVLVAGLIIAFGFNEEGEVGYVFWNSIAAVINAYMPSFEEGSPGYLLLMTVSALAGLLFTSVLIGIITSAIEEKIYQLKKGNSLVLERDHIVVLGYSPGEYTLIQQLILATGNRPLCLVLGENMEREDMEQDLFMNVKIPGNVKVVCRTVDITDPVSIDKCSVHTCKTVIISPTEDARTVKAVLAVSSLLEQRGAEGVRVNAIVSKNEFRFPPSLAEAHNISTLQTNDILAKMIAHSCTQVGLSESFREIFNFEGSEFYLLELPEVRGWSFDELMVSMEYAVPVGLLHGGKILLNPPADFRIGEEDRVIAFAEDNQVRSSVTLQEVECPPEPENEEVSMVRRDTTDTVIIGHNETLPIILQELPENVHHVYLTGQKLTEEERAELEQVAEKRNLQLKTYRGNLRSERFLLELARMAEHIVILGDHDKDPETADMDAIFLLLNLRDLRSRFQLSFNITVEMQKEHNQNLVGTADKTDFLVTSSMSSLILAQLAESPELSGVFREILSNEGNELYLKNARDIRLCGTYTVQQLRRIVLRRGYILLGYVDAENRSVFNPPLHESITLGKSGSLIVLGLC